jgi:hypothetical protein
VCKLIILSGIALTPASAFQACLWIFGGEQAWNSNQLYADVWRL